MNYIDPHFVMSDKCICASHQQPRCVHYRMGHCKYKPTPWETAEQIAAMISDSGDEQPQSSPSIDWNAVFAVPVEEKIEVVPDLKVKAETPEERDRLWKLVQQYAGS